MFFRLKQGLAPIALAGALLAAAPVVAASAESLIARSHTAAAKGQFDDAVMLMQAAIVADPSRAETYVSLGDLYADNKDLHFAHKYYDEALYLDPALPSALKGAGLADLALGARKAAEDKLTRLEKVCGPDCKETAALRAALDAGKNARADAAPQSMDKP